jgi:hypothetical protein
VCLDDFASVEEFLAHPEVKKFLAAAAARQARREADARNRHAPP